MQVPFIDFTGTPFVEKDARLTPVALAFMSQLILQMQQNLSNEGYVIPSQNQDNINILTKSTDGTLVWNTTTQQLQVSVNGVWFNVDRAPFVPQFTWNIVTNATVNMLSDNGYISDRPSLIMYVLPVASLIGDIIEVTQKNSSGSFMISQNVGQQIIFGDITTTLGTAGSITSSSVGDALRMVCVEDNLTWQVLSCIGNPSYI